MTNFLKWFYNLLKSAIFIHDIGLCTSIYSGIYRIETISEIIPHFKEVNRYIQIAFCMAMLLSLKGGVGAHICTTD